MKLKITFFILLSVFCFSLLAQETPCGEGIEGYNHPNGDGFVANTATVDDTSYIDSDSAVCADSEVSNSKILESSLVLTGTNISNSEIHNSRVYNSEVSRSTFKDSRIFHATVDDLRGSGCQINNENVRCSKTFDKYEPIPFADDQGQIQAQASQINPFEMFSLSCTSGYDYVEISESVIQCRPTCETAAKLAGYSQSTVYKSRYHRSDTWGNDNNTIRSCAALNNWDGRLGPGRGKGYEGHRDWRGFTFENSLTGEIEDNSSVSEVVNHRRQTRGVYRYVSVCCVRR